MGGRDKEGRRANSVRLEAGYNSQVTTHARSRGLHYVRGML